MKIIFLDIDGVLNHELWYKSRTHSELTMEELKLVAQGKIKESKLLYDKNQFDPERVELLNSLTDDTGAKIVVSSSWRKSRTLEDMQLLLNEIVGVKAEIIGLTPYLQFFDPDNEEYKYSVPRGCEIKAWIDKNIEDKHSDSCEFKYVIFDDDSDMLYQQKNNYIRVDRYCGLTSTNIFFARQILNQ